MLTGVRQNRYLLVRILRNSCRQYASGHLNGPLSLDPSLEALLKDADMAISKHKLTSQPRAHRELQATLATSQDIEQWSPDRESAEEEHLEDENAPVYRKSPAARYGSDSIGAVVLPLELEASIRQLIEESDKPQLHADAKRLFYDEENDVNAEENWATSFEARYKSRSQRERLSERDGTAFISVALPAQYAAITAVLSQIQHRVEREYKVSKVIDWGSGAGSAMWACLHAFQSRRGARISVDSLAADSSIANYVGIDKREGLVHMAKKLTKKNNIGRLNAAWQKSFHESDRLDRKEAQDVLAISAFTLTSLPNSLARKTMVKEMWESGADTIVLIDHNTKEGFETIADAREYLLKLGRKEMEDPDAQESIRGSYVVAPCPNDGKCPLRGASSSKLVCGFEQRLQRPAFVRLTKHSRVGYEDIGYSYVVIRRGSRPKHPGTQVGRIGAVGKRALVDMAQRMPPKELMLHDGSELSNGEHPTYEEERESGFTEVEDVSADITESLRLESYHWPRLVFPPLKKSGHIILDSCTPEAKIMRLTIPKSQGKQEFYDARKSSWGDLFPHEPKNRPQVRVDPSSAGTGEHVDIGKRKEKGPKKSSASNEGVLEELKRQKKRIRRERTRELDDFDEE